ncbi:hypothetical protein O181_131206 [Austropuccinia psidii MF-1]|uniref:Uncharacterized protein n=1 Tax=Austropuccinia psidii MF-1 TaxID=1389203 RepID=A0A9Q3L477_9BASI|nr:hypothetical protein [Austropuccinia psidii MF-1]
MESTSNPKQNKELNKILENIMDNQPKNGNDYGQETVKKESRETSIKNNMDESKPVLPQEIARSPIGFSKISQAEASHKQDNNFQPFPSNMENIDPRLIIENKDITKQNLKKSKIGIRKSEQELSKELIQEQKKESDTYLPKENNLFHIHTPNKDPIFLQYPQHLKAFNPNSKVKKQIQS